MNMKTVKAVVASAAMLAGALCASAEGQDTWTYVESGKITDGVWVLYVSENNNDEQLTVIRPASATKYSDGMTLDLTKPVEGNKKFVAINRGDANKGSFETESRLSEVRLPETLRTLGVRTFYGSGLKSIDLHTVKSLPSKVFKNCASLTNVVLSSELTSIGEEAFKDCTALQTVTPFLPETVTSIAASAFSGCKVLAGDLVLGTRGAGLEFASGGSQFYGCKAIRSITVNGNVTSLPGNFASMGQNWSSSVLEWVKIYSTTELTFGEDAICGSTKLTNFCVNAYATCKSHLFRWCTTQSGDNDLTIRFCVPVGDPKWQQYIASSEVTKWPAMSDKYPGDAEQVQPLGWATISNPYGAKVWILPWVPYDNEVVATATGYEGDTDGELHGINVKVLFPADETFTYEWSTDGQEWVSEEPKFQEAGEHKVWCRISAEGFEKPAVVSANVILHAVNLVWAYDASAKTISDGVWVLNVTDNNGELTVTGPASGTSYRSGMTLDLRKPVDSGKTIVALGDSFKNNDSLNANLKTVLLPDTLRSIGSQAFYHFGNLETVEPFLPTSVTSVGICAFEQCGIRGDLVLGTRGEDLTFQRSGSDGWQFKNCYNVRSITVNGNVKTFPKSFARMEDASKSALEWVEIYSETNSTFDSDIRFSSNKLTNFCVNAYATFNSNIFEGCPDYQIRFRVPRTNADWLTYINNNATKWADLNEETRKKYPGDPAQETPVGLAQIKGRYVWVLFWSPNGEELIPVMATATGYEGVVDGESHGIEIAFLNPDESQCTCQWSVDDGDWSDTKPDIREEGTYEVSCKISADGFTDTVVSANVILHTVADHWTYDSGKITDGVWVLNVTDNDGELTVGKPSSTTAYYPGMDLDLTKPVDGKTIVAIGKEAFYNNDLAKANLKTVRLPETLRSIGSRAFQNCKSLETIEPFLPASVTSIGPSVFEGCNILAGDLVLGTPDTALDLDIGSDKWGYHLKGCCAITSITLNGDVTAIPNQFANMDGNTKSALTNVVLSSKLTSIGDSAFRECTSLRTVTPFLPETITSIDNAAFQNCQALEGDLVLGTRGKSLALIGWSNHFFNCYGIRSITVNGDVENFPQWFVYMDNTSKSALEWVEIYSETKSTFANHAFRGTSNLTNFCVNAFATFAGEMFNGCSDYKIRFRVPRMNPDWVTYIESGAVTKWNDITDESVKAKYPGDPVQEPPVGYAKIGGRQVWILYWSPDGDEPENPVIASVKSYEGEVDGESHGIDVKVVIPEDASLCTYRWSTDDKQTWSETKPDLRTAGEYMVWCEISAEDYDTTVVSAKVILHTVNDHWTYDSGKITDGIWTLNVTDNNGELTIGMPSSSNTKYYPGMILDLRKPVEGKTIVAIGDLAFTKYNNDNLKWVSENLKTVRLPDTLRSIGYRAFQYCECLETVEPFLPESVTKVSGCAFESCYALSGDLVLGKRGVALTIEGDTSGSGWQFFRCYAIRSMTVNGDVTLFPHNFAKMEDSTKSVLEWIKIYSETKSTFAQTAIQGMPNLTNFCINAFATFNNGGMFSGCKEDQIFFRVPKANEEWAAYIESDKVTKWDALTDAQKAKYPGDPTKKKPVGYAKIPFNDGKGMWIFYWNPNPAGFKIIVR